MGLLDKQVCLYKSNSYVQMSEYMAYCFYHLENAKSLGDKKKEILQKRLNELCDVLDPNLIIPQLSIDGFITTDEEDNIARNREIITKRDKNRALVRLMVLKDVNEFWDFLIKYLEKGRYGIRRELLSDLDSA